MSFQLTWMPHTLQAAGLKVAAVDGWRDRGRAEMGMVRGVMCHMTVGAIQGNMPSLRLLMEGRPDLAGPLSQLGLGRDGTFYVIAAGRCNHAGDGEWKGIRTGNSSFIGIEAENAGHRGDPWPDVQIDAYQRGVAALLQRIGASVDFCAGHREYALPKGRKGDPNFDMDAFRTAVADLMRGAGSPRPMIPPVELGPAGRPTLRRGVVDARVKDVQRAIGVDEDGVFGPHTEAMLREFQRRHGLVPDGIVGPKTWATIS